jgi:hypothetical protein
MSSTGGTFVFSFYVNSYLIILYRFYEKTKNVFGEKFVPKVGKYVVDKASVKKAYR